MLVKSLVPHIVQFLRNEIAPRLQDTTTPLKISQFDISRINKLIGKSIWQGEYPVICFEKTSKPVSTYINPFSKALST